MLTPKECDGECGKIVLADEADQRCPACGGDLCDVERNDLETLVGDHVHCDECDQDSIGPLGSDVCIKCGGGGGLRFVDEGKPKAAPTNDARGALLLAGNFWDEAQADADLGDERPQVLGGDH